jgi:hypothetical protein
VPRRLAHAAGPAASHLGENPTPRSWRNAGTLVGEEAGAAADSGGPGLALALLRGARVAGVDQMAARQPAAAVRLRSQLWLGRGGRRRVPDAAPGESEVWPWRSTPLPALLELVLAAAGNPQERPRTAAVDGRGASGTSTLAARLSALAPASTVVHTDDLAWHEPLLGSGYLWPTTCCAPCTRGRALAYRPPQWERRGRNGVIAVPAGLDVVLVEGPGASQREHADCVRRC